MLESNPVVRPMVALVATLCCVGVLDAHPLSFTSTVGYSTTQPPAPASPIANWTGAAYDAANIGGSGVNADGGSNNGAANDASTYVANNQPRQGQAFTTGSNPNGYDLTSITVRMAGYSANIVSAANQVAWDLNAKNGPIIAEIGRITGGTGYATVSKQNFMAGSTGHPGAGSSVNGAGTYITFNLPYTVHLEPASTYGFDLTIGNNGNNYFEWLGISTTIAPDPYTGGAAYNRSGATLTPLSGERVFMLGLTERTTPYAPFVHPGALHTQADFDRMAAKVAANAQPWKAGYDILAASPYTSTGWPAYNVDYIDRGGASNNYTRCQEDAQVIYELALRWKITGNTAYADKAVQIANVWSDLIGISGDSNASLASGICGYLFACGGEILSTYPAWPAAEKQAYKDMMMRVFYPANFDFLWRHHETFHTKGGNTHYRLNWDTANVASLAAIGILCDNKAVYDQAIDYFKNGTGNGRVERAAWYLFPEGGSQTEESGRDQGHNLGGWYAMGLLCQMAWNQGEDLFAYDNNRVLRAYEANAKYNLGNEVPWVFHRNASLTYTETLSAAGRGLGGYYPWELVYNHYANIKGIDAPWCGLALNATRPEPRPNKSIHPSQEDWFGLGSLTFARDAIAAGVPPGGLRAHWSKNRVVLNWWGSATATSYQVKRATSAAGPFTTLGTITGADLNFADTDVSNSGIYHYKVTALTPGGELDSQPLRVARELVTRYTFEGNADDAVGSRDADLLGGATAPGFAPGFGGGQAVSFDGGGQFVRLPSGSGNYQDITVSAWVFWNGGGAWQRVFDFGSEIEKYMMLTVNAGSNQLRFQMTTSRNTDGSVTINGPTMPVAAWTHVTITINGDTATMYVNGTPVGSAASDGRISPLFAQPFCYLGRSMWNNDPYFSGRIDDFRIYNHALSGNEVHALWGQAGANAAPSFSSDPMNPPAATEDADYSAAGQTLAASASDSNGGTLLFSKVSGPAWLTVSGNGALSGTPSNNDVGGNLFVVRVTDSSGATDDANLRIIVTNTNDAPVWAASPLVKRSVTRGQPYLATSLAEDASDVDSGTVLDFSKVAGPAWLSVAADGTLSGTPGAGDVGANSFTVRVTDNTGASSDAILHITVLDFQARAHLAFEDNTDDNLGNFSGTAAGVPAYATGRINRGIVLDGVDDTVTLPAAVADSQDITIAAWVLWNGGGNQQRVFDFGNDTNQHLYLTPNYGGGMRFAIKNGGAEQQVNYSPALPTGQWAHIAVTLGGNTATLYLNGNAVASNMGITIHPGDFKPVWNYLGKSQWADPLFSGRLDGFRVYNHALSPPEIAILLDEVPAVPMALTATPKAGCVDLTWSASQGAQTYTVKRAISSGGTYATIAGGLTATTFVDTSVSNGTLYYYVISASNAKGESPDSDQVSAVPSDLLVHLKFDETSGISAADSSGNGWNATLVNTPAWTPGFSNGSLNLPATASQHLTLPAGIVSGLADFSISGWLKVGAFANWARVFDFGTGTNNYMFLAPQYTTTAPNAAKFRFAIRTASVGEQLLTSSTAIAAGSWVHYAVTLSGNTGRMYLNGALVATNTGMTLRPSSLGSTTLNYLGRSQFSDPYLNAQFDDFRIHSRALSAAEIATAANTVPETPSGLTAGAGDTRIPLAWSISNFASSYSVKRSTTSGGPYTVIASGLTSPAFTDTGLANDTTYYHVVSATNPFGESANSAEISATPSHLRVHLKLDESTGTTAADASGLGWHGSTVNNPSWGSGKLNNGLDFSSASAQYLTLPTDVISGLTSTTLMAWVNLNGAPSTWQRIFDFGTDTTNYMFLCTQYGTGGSVNKLRFAIRTPLVGEEFINSAISTPLDSWVHVAVVLSGSTGRLYLNGVQVGVNNAMTLTPSSLGSTTRNYLGKSQWNDPYLNASIDDFRIYSREMTAGEIADFAAVGTAMDLWRLANFDTPINAGSAANTADPDGDGRSNLLEYATGTNPNTLQMGPPAVMGVSPDGLRLTLKFHRIADPALTYQVVATGDLSSWSGIWSSTGDQNEEGQVEVQDPELKGDHPARFLRLEVEP